MECFAIISKTRYLLLLIRRENQKEENKRGHAHTKRKKRERKESLPSFSYSAPVRIRRADGSLFFFFGAYIFLFIFFPLVFFFFLFFFRCAVPPPVRGRPRLMMSSAGWVSIAGRPLDQLLAGSRRFADRVKLNENQPPNPPAPPPLPSLTSAHTLTDTQTHTDTHTRMPQLLVDTSRCEEGRTNAEEKGLSLVAALQRRLGWIGSDGFTGRLPVHRFPYFFFKSYRFHFLWGSESQLNFPKIFLHFSLFQDYCHYSHLFSLANFIPTQLTRIEFVFNKMWLDNHRPYLKTIIPISTIIFVEWVRLIFSSKNESMIIKKSSRNCGNMHDVLLHFTGTLDSLSSLRFLRESIEWMRKR